MVRNFYRNSVPLNHLPGKLDKASVEYCPFTNSVIVVAEESFKGI